MIMRGTHDWALVALSILIAIFASFTALSLAGRVRESGGWMRRVWIATAAAALGGGIWSMHFVAMLAFRMPGMAMAYDPALTLLSLAIALIFTTAGFAVMRWNRVTLARIAGAGLLMGLGVVTMHYVGMAAMRMPATLSYDPRWVALSILIAIGAASAALWLAARDRQPARQFIAASVMGIAIAGMHYAGMQGAIFMAHPGHAPLAEPGLDQTYLAAIIATLTVLILLMALGAARLEQLFRGFGRREARIALRLRIADVLRGRETGEALQEVAALVGRHFAVQRAGYGQLDPQDDMIDYDVCWTDGNVPPVLGRVGGGAFSHRLFAALRAGKTVVIEDVEFAAIDDAERARIRAVDTRAALIVPYVRDQQLRTILYLNAAEPRRWHREEVAFLEEIAERTRAVLERGAVEAALRDLNATLEARVEARTDELREAQEALLQSRKMEAVGQLVAGLAHDFNNVLGAVVGGFDLIRRRAGEADRVRTIAEAGLEAADRGAKLTAQLLAFSRSQRIQLQSLYVCDVIGALHDLLARTLGPMIRLDLALNPSPVPVLADETQVEMMILNLAINARDAMPAGGTLTIATAPRSVAGDPELADGVYVELAVADTGTGMDEDTLRRAMEPFFTTKPVGKGTGLGLAQIYGSARQAGGTVRIESAPGAGTTVRVLLPRTDRARASRAIDAVPDATAGPLVSRHVLLVDDDAALRTMLAGALRMQGHDVVEADDGPTALALLEGTTPDIAVIDFAMPGMTGAELAARIADRWPALPVLLASGFADTAAIEAAIGPDAVMLRKPFRIDTLLAAIERAIRADLPQTLPPPPPPC